MSGKVIYYNGFIIEIVNEKLMITRDRSTVTGDTEGYTFDPIDRTKILSDDSPVCITPSLTNSFIMILCKSGTIRVWGSNKSDELGLGMADKKFISSPFSIIGPGFTSFSCGVNHSCGIDKKGVLWSWGFNEYKQLGLSYVNFAVHPISTFINCEMVACGNGFTAYIHDGVLKVVGNHQLNGKSFKLDKNVDQLECDMSNIYTLSEHEVSVYNDDVKVIPFKHKTSRLIRGYDFIISMPVLASDNVEIYRDSVISSLSSELNGQIVGSDTVSVSMRTIMIKRDIVEIIKLC